MVSLTPLNPPVAVACSSQYLNNYPKLPYDKAAMAVKRIEAFPSHKIPDYKNPIQNMITTKLDAGQFALNHVVQVQVWERDADLIESWRSCWEGAP